jgi:alcohol dehydrogenase class IV
MAIHTFSFPTEIRFGAGARHQIATHLAEKGFRRPLVVTDAGLAALPAFASLVEGLQGGPLEVAVFSGVAGNPVESQVVAGAEAWKAHRADCLVGVGGGAALDVAKAIAVMAHHPGSILDYEDGAPGAKPIDREVPHWVAVPTTAGTGSEVGRSTVISDAQHVKRIVFSPRLLARVVFADPELTLALPPKVTAATGMDALTHCIESYLAKDYHPLCDGIALEGLRIASRALPRCVQDGSDLAARSDMLMASMMGAIAFQKGLGITHSCAHALSTAADLHHGLANGVMIEHALRFNVEACTEKFRVLARAVELREQTGEAFLQWLVDLKTRIGIPTGLQSAGVPRSALDVLPTLAFQDSCHLNNPRPVTEADFRQIYTAAFA